MAMKLTTKTERAEPCATKSSNKSVNSMKRRSLSLRKISDMNSRTDRVSRVMVWRALSLARLRMSCHADFKSSGWTAGRALGANSSTSALAIKKSRPATGLCAKFCAASLICSYSNKRRTNSARGSSTSSPVSDFFTGNNMRDLISISIAAIKRYSDASSKL